MNQLAGMDYFIVMIFLFSVLTGLLRGVIKEVLSLLVWVVAFIAASMFAGSLANWFTNNTSVQSLVDVSSNNVSLLALSVSFIGIFLGTMIVGSIVSTLLSSAISGIGLGFLNRILGAMFGFARGFLINVVIIFLLSLTPITTYSFWTEAHLISTFQPAVTWMQSKIQPELDSLKSKADSSLGNIGSSIGNFKQIYSP